MQRGTEYKGVKVLGRIDNLEIVLPQNRLDEIIITLGLAEYHKLERIVNMCEKSGVHTKFVPDYNKVIPSRALYGGYSGAACGQHPQSSLK